MSFSLIVPIAADRPEYQDRLPHVFEKNHNGLFLCVEAIRGIFLDAFDAIYYVILEKLQKRHDVKEELIKQLISIGAEHAEVILLSTPTASQPETIYKVIEQCNIKGSIFIKDPDGFFRGEILPYNGVTTYPLERMSLVDPQNKSYVAVDDLFCVTNIIEKKVIGNLFNAGGYIFEDADQYCYYYQNLKQYSPLYLSHVIYAMLLDKVVFRPVPVTDYEDWGTSLLYKLKNFTA